MKLKKFTLTENDKSYVFDEVVGIYVESEDQEESLTVEEVESLLDEGKLSFSESDVVISEEDDKDEDEKDEDDTDEKDEDEKEMKEEELEAKLSDILNFKVELSEEDKSNLFGESNEEISEEDQEKTVTVFEAAVQVKAKELVEESQKVISEHYEAVTEQYNESMRNDVNDYLDYVVTKWVGENEIAIEESLKTQMNDNFIEKLSELFKEHYIEVPEGRYDILEGLANRAEELQTKLDEQIEENVKLTAKNKKSEKENFVAELSESLADSQKEKFNNLLENIKDLEIEEFKGKAKHLLEAYFKKPGSAGNVDDENLISEDKGTKSSKTQSKIEELIAAASKV